MRSRLTLAFGFIAVLLATCFVGFRIISLTDLAEHRVSEEAQHEALVVATLLGEGLEDDAVAPSPASLAPFAVPDRQVVVAVEGGGSSQVDGDGWSADDDADALAGTATVRRVTVTVRVPHSEVDHAVSDALPSLLALAAALVAFAVVAGALVASRLSKPFAQLAEAATALARGRSDLHLPRTRIAEARAIGLALEAGAAQLSESLRRERDLALRASHELRTPLTSLSLALHDLTDREDASDDLVEAADLAARIVARLDTAVGEVLEETRSHPVIAGAQLPLSLVVPALAQRWADTLALAGVAVQVDLVGDATLQLTPGPLEQILDEVLLAALACRGRRALLAVDGSERHVRVTITVEGGTPSTDHGPLDRALSVVDTVGGRMSGSLVDPDGLVLVLPRR